jgi:predicted amidohydrolase YtcJ
MVELAAAAPDTRPVKGRSDKGEHIVKQSHRRRARVRTFVSSLALVAAVALAGAYAASARQSAVGTASAGNPVLSPPDLLLVSGKITTEDAKSSSVQALAIRAGDVLATGTNAKILALKGPRTKVIDLGGRRVIPGLIDGHLHGLRNGYHCFTRALRLDNVYARSQALQLYGDLGRANSAGTWVWTVGGGWNVNQLDRPGMFTLAELDAALPNNPAYVAGTGFTGVQTNTKGLQALGLAAGSPGVAVDASGKATGQLTGAASAAAGAAIIAQLDQLSIDDQAGCLAAFVRAENSYGLTSWVDGAGNQQPFNVNGGCQEFAQGQHAQQAVLELWRDRRLNARVAYHEMNNFSGLQQLLLDQRHPIGFLGDDMLRKLGVGEEVLCPGNQPPPNPDEYQAIVNYLASNRVAFQNHASSDATQTAMLGYWEKANQIYPIAKLRWTIAHPGDDGVSPTDATLARVKALGVGVDPSDSGANGGASKPALMGSIFRSGVHMCLSTDAMNVAPFNPMVDLWYVVSGKTLDPNVPGLAVDQRLTRAQALAAKTRMCAWNMYQDGKVGSLHPGAHADLAVLDADYFAVPTDKIRELRSVLTLVGGRVTYAAAPYAKLDPLAAKS